MSYLDVPRIHFGGLFYTDPSTINNYTPYYDPAVNLKQPDGTYIVDLPTGGKNWNPTGVSQWWLEHCQVLSVVGPTGEIYRDAASDPLIGAAVQTPSPGTPQSDGAAGYLDLAKMVDLDPDQQGRSELFGVWIFVKTSSGGGFRARWDRPNLRFATIFHGTGGFDGYMQKIGGSWKARLTDIAWNGNETGMLKTLRDQSPEFLEMKLSVDLYQRDRSKSLDADGAGNRFGYGRVMGTIGPSSSAEPSQIVAGRMLLTPPQAPPRAVAAMSRERDRPMPAMPTIPAPEPQPVTAPTTGPSTAVAAAPATDAVAAPSAASSILPWNSAPFVVRTVHGKSLLTVDLGMSIPLQDQGRGKLNVPGPVSVADASGAPFPNATITIDDSSYVTLPAALPIKNTVWLENAGVCQVELSAEQAAAIDRHPVALQIDNSPVLAEAPDGYFVAIDPPVLRMEPSATNTQSNAWLFQFGQGLKNWPTGFELQPQVLQWSSPPGENDPVPTPTQDFSATVAQTAPTPGCFPLTVKTGPAVPLPDMRKPLDSQMYLLGIAPDRTAELQMLELAPLSLLFWQNHWLVETPTWDNSIGAILNGYARLYPGMKGKLDIGDRATVVGFVQPILELMSSDFDDPAYMPVVRDLSPSVVSMVLDWLQKTMDEASA